jgi:hypothetical protein
MNRCIRLLGLFVCVAALAACATSGATYQEMRDGAPTLTPGMGRIYFYRPSQFGAAIRPDVSLDGSVVGTAISHGFFYVDTLPGTHEVVLNSEVTDKTQVRLAAGETSYVRIESAMGILFRRFYSRQVVAATGESEMWSLHYTGD